MTTQRWEVEHPFGEPGVYVGDQDTALIAKLYGPDAEANARLIAALPDLLAALERLVAADNCNYLVETIRYEGYFDAARAAIAKAKGE